MPSFDEQMRIRRKVRKAKNKIKHKILIGSAVGLSIMASIVFVTPIIIQSLSSSLSPSYHSISNEYTPSYITNRQLLQGITAPDDSDTDKENEGYPPDALDEEQRKNGGWILYFLGLLYTFVGIALVCDEWFVPAIEVIVQNTNMTPDAAGATWMAAGGSAPELFTSFIGTFISRSNVGFGTIVGSAVFNVLFVIGCCAIFTPGHLPLTWFPFARDCMYYIFSLVMLAIFYGVATPDTIYWYEALILFLLYICYVSFMFKNQKIKKWLFTKYGLDKNNKKNEDEVKVELGRSDNDDKKDEEDPDFYEGPAMPFHASLLDYLTKDITIQDMIGIHVVSIMKGEVRETFEQIDADGNGHIDRDELKQVLLALGDAQSVVTDEIVNNCFNEIDTDGNNEISFLEFSDWYLKSKGKIESDVLKTFNQFDDDGDGHINASEVKSLLETITSDDDTKEITDSDVELIMKQLDKSTDDRISESEFLNWYSSSPYFEAKQLKRQATLLAVDEEDANDEGIELDFPDGWIKRILFIITAPIMFSLYYTLPDVQKESRKHLWPLTFTGSMLWLMFYSYIMVWFAVRIGDAWGVPDEVMGLTFLAAGTSVPDLISSVLVAKMGQGDMAVSSSIGSNIFDILVGLPIPWLLFTITIGTEGEAKINVASDSLFLSVIILIIMLFIVLIIIKLNKWKLTHQLGWTMFVLWILFVTQDLIRQFCESCNP